MRACCITAALLLGGCAASATGPADPRFAAESASSGAESDAPPATAADAPEAVEETAPSEPLSPQARALARAFEARLTVWTRPDGTAVLTRRCREGPVPCRARLARLAALIEQTARRHDLDPFLLAALAMRESGLDPAALGRRREAGIVQLHPRGAGRGVRYVEDAAYRERCQSELGACQGPVLEVGARTLADAVRECGGLVRGLGAYATGHCTGRARHPQQVLEERDRLRQLAR